MKFCVTVILIRFKLFLGLNIVKESRLQLFNVYYNHQLLQSGVTITLGNTGAESDWPYQASIEAAKSFGANVELKVTYKIKIYLEIMMS